eukprot:scaffold2644_cov129-Cylindrotheca_fusiformis.AAC.6
MAARKSCTHMTWSEAKAKSGEGKAGGKKKAAKKVSHDKLLADKIIAKGNNQSESDRIAGRQAARRARKDEERAKILEEKRMAEKEQQRQEQVVKPYEQAAEKMASLAREHRQRMQAGATDEHSSYAFEDLKEIAECKQIQLDEILALEAIFMDTEAFQMAEACQIDELREKMNAFDDSDDVSLRSIARHPPIAFSLQHTIDDPDGSDLVANMLLHVELPPFYPLKQRAAPNFEIGYFMLTDKTMVCSANKPLETLGFLEESSFIDAIKAEAQMLLPDPCIYELSSAWPQDQLFEKFISMKTI